MPHNSFAFMVIVGVGIGAFLYYMFAGNPHQQYSNDGGGGYYDTKFNDQPCSSSFNDESTSRRRKRGSSVAAGKTICTVCQAELADKASGAQDGQGPCIVELLPCGHTFHKSCIAKWRDEGPLATNNTCPNCREGIVGTNVSN